MVTRSAKCASKANLLWLGMMLLATVSASAQQFATIDPPGSVSTTTGAINDLGQVVGDYFDSNGVDHGFLYSAGVFSTIDVPQSISTVSAGINNNGQIVGSYVDANNLSHGYSLTNGIFTTIDDPAFSEGTFLVQISDLGLIAGFGVDAEGVTHGFTLNNGTFTTIDFPGANFTEPLDLSFNGAEIVGAYSLPSFPANTSQGFTYIYGAFASVTFPKSVSTALNGVNDGGQIAGTYVLPEQTIFHAFFQNGTISTTEDFPGAVSTGAANINDSGQIVGAYVDDENVTHGYLMTNGPFAYAPVRSANSVAVFDISTQLRVATIQVGSGPVGIGLSPNGAFAYVANYQGGSVSVVNTTSNSVVATVQVGASPLGVAVTPNGSFAYVANNFSNSVSVISTASNTVVATVQLGSIPSFVAITPDGNFVYVTNQGSSNMSVISTASNTVVATVPLAAGPVGLAITPDGQFVYVTVAGTNSVAVISTATNIVVNTIPVGAAPVRISITPDGSTAYVSNQNSGNVLSVINLATNTVVENITVGSTPYGSAVTPDGAYDWIIDAGSGQISVVSTATNTVVATVPLSGGSDIAIASATPTSQPITQPLSPTQSNVFNFGTSNFVVQYPAGTSFSGVNMTATDVEMTQSQFQQRVAGTQFANATCIVYSGTGGNCTDYQVTCSNSQGGQITCPGEPQPTIAVQTGFTTVQPITNPGYLTTPIGLNEWQNIFTGFSDPTVKGKTKGFSEFVAVDLGATNSQGLAKFAILSPQLPKGFCHGEPIPISIQLTSVATGGPITDAQANISVLMIADVNGNPTQQTVLSKTNAFRQTTPGVYRYEVGTTNYAAGTYMITIYGNAFPAYQGQFEIGRAHIYCGQ